MATELKGTAIVTGSANGIGRAIAIRLAEDGFNIALFDLPSTEASLLAVAEEIKQRTDRRTLQILGDVSLEEDVKELVGAVVKEWGGLDVMVANAGVGLSRPFHETTVEDFDRLVNVNQRGTFLCYKYAAVQMIKQGRGGRILGACSVAGKKGLAENAVYSSTKFAIRGLTQSAAMEYGKFGITVNAYSPGAIETVMLRGMDEATTQRNGSLTGSWMKSLIGTTFLGRNGEPRDVVGTVSFLVSKDAAFITGQSINICGGYAFD
ncbi:hypothetical protein AcW1_007150 [Taiwanofungus camphoratus]|nr:hypothetical protein AcV5_008150 [Antrodia cinnamomea]KAI0930974.1 hypothetical protein AcV7_005009 [Antrodia cinnamomea]KAI0952748.1 hypothetical protein AcW1_007150 [Antrodia cinnamomea]